MDVVISSRKICYRKVSESERAAARKVAVEVKQAPPRPQTIPINGDALNKHQVLYRRDLTDHEQTIIKVEFLKLNGIFESLKKDCTRIRAKLGNDVSVFQVSGFVTRLHQQVMAGELEVRDINAYRAAIRSHRKHWLTYEGDKYDEMRSRVRTPRASRGPDRPTHRVVR